MSNYMVPSHVELIAALTEQRNRMARWVAAERSEELARPLTPSEVEGSRMWQAKEHLAHAVGVETYLQSAVQRTLAGEEDATGFATRVGALERVSLMETINEAINEASERTFATYREVPLERLVERLKETQQATLELLESLSDAQLARVAPHSPFGQGTVGELFLEMARQEGQHVDWLTEALAQHKEN